MSLEEAIEFVDDKVTCCVLERCFEGCVGPFDGTTREVGEVRVFDDRRPGPKFPLRGTVAIEGISHSGFCWLELFSEDMSVVVAAKQLLHALLFKVAALSSSSCS